MKEFDSAHWAQAWPYPRPDLPPVARPGEAEHTVSVWLLPKFSMLTLFCLLEPLRVANRFGRTLFAWQLLSSGGEAVVASNGVRIDVDGALGGAGDCKMLMAISSYEAEATVTAADRAVCKTRSVYANGSWDVCDRTRSRGFRWADLSEQELPASLRGKHNKGIENQRKQMYRFIEPN